MTKGTSVNFTCKSHGKPTPVITWMFNNKPNKLINNPRVVMADNRQTLILLDVGMGDEGRYECVSSNIGGSVTRFQLVKLKQTTQQSSVYSSQIAIPIYIAAGVALFIAIVTLIGIKCCCKRSIKSPATPPTPRLTQYEQPEDTESCRLTGTLRETRDSRDTVSPCHGFHQYQTCQNMQEEEHIII